MEPTVQKVRFSLEGLVADGCDLAVCTLLGENGRELARVDQMDPDVLIGVRTDIELRTRVPGKAVQCAVSARTPDGFTDRTVVPVS